MSNIDEQNRSGLAVEKQARRQDTDDEASIFELVAMTFQGKQAWVTWLVWISGFAIFVLGLLFLRQYLGATDLKESLSWALAIIACLIAIGLIKIFAWMQMLRAEQMREMKRLEMRVLLAMERSDPV